MDGAVPKGETINIVVKDVSGSEVQVERMPPMHNSNMPRPCMQRVQTQRAHDAV